MNGSNAKPPFGKGAVFIEWLAMAYDKLSCLFSFIEKILCVCLGICMAAMASLLISQVVMRYLFSSSVDGAWELARLTFVSALLLGIPVALRRGLHVGIDFSIGSRKPTAKLLIKIVRVLLVGALFVIVLDKSFVLYKLSADEMLNSISLSKNVFYLAQIIASAVCILFCAESILKYFSEYRKETTGEPSEG
jgi:TRAP-type C4-dicarboxylate transport system permease small subunit|tara:strand:- start:721 stop:1296 length:576 start_codon:yes stop_codon:yes gene_type:complete